MPLILQQEILRRPSGATYHLTIIAQCKLCYGRPEAFTASNGWSIVSNAQPDIDSTKKIFFIRGKLQGLDHITLATTAEEAAKIAKAVKEFNKELKSTPNHRSYMHYDEERLPGAHSGYLIKFSSYQSFTPGEVYDDGQIVGKIKEAEHTHVCGDTLYIGTKLKSCTVDQRTLTFVRKLIYAYNHLHKLNIPATSVIH